MLLLLFRWWIETLVGAIADAWCLSVRSYCSRTHTSTAHLHAWGTFDGGTPVGRLGKEGNPSTPFSNFRRLLGGWRNRQVFVQVITKRPLLHFHCVVCWVMIRARRWFCKWRSLQSRCKCKLLRHCGRKLMLLFCKIRSNMRQANRNASCSSRVTTVIAIVVATTRVDEYTRVYTKSFACYKSSSYLASRSQALLYRQLIMKHWRWLSEWELWKGRVYKYKPVEKTMLTLHVKKGLWITILHYKYK